MTPTPSRDDDLKDLLTESMTPEPPMVATVGDAVHRGRKLRRRRRVAMALGAGLGLALVAGTAYGVTNLMPSENRGVAGRTTVVPTPKPKPTVEHEVVKPSPTLVCFKLEGGGVEVFPEKTSFNTLTPGDYFVTWPIGKPYSFRSADVKNATPVPCPAGSIVPKEKLGPIYAWQNVVVGHLGPHYVPNNDGGGGLGRWEGGKVQGTVAVDVYRPGGPEGDGPKNYFMTKGPDGELCAITPAKGAGRERFRWTSCESETLADGSTLKVGSNSDSLGVSLFRTDGTVVTISVSMAYFEGGSELDKLPITEAKLRAVVTDSDMLKK